MLGLKKILQSNYNVNLLHVQPFSLTSAQYNRHRTPTHLYDVLGITPKATNKQIKSAYYKLTKIYHPDVNPGNSESAQKFLDITEAYEVLGNSFTRKKYDRGLLHPTDSRNQGENYSPERNETTFTPKHYQKRGGPVTGRTKYYDFDEYYKKHYGEQVLQQFKHRHSGQAPAATDQRRVRGVFQPVKDGLRTEEFNQSPVAAVFILLGFSFLCFTLIFMDSEIVRELERSPAFKDSPMLYGDIPNDQDSTKSRRE